MTIYMTPATVPTRTGVALPAWLTHRRLAIGAAVAGVLLAIGIIAALATGHAPPTRPAAAASQTGAPDIEMTPESRPAHDPAIDATIARAAKGGGEPTLRLSDYLSAPSGNGARLVSL